VPEGTKENGERYTMKHFEPLHPLEVERRQ